MKCYYILVEVTREIQVQVWADDMEEAEDLAEQEALNGGGDIRFEDAEVLDSKELPNTEEEG